MAALYTDRAEAGRRLADLLVTQLRAGAGGAQTDTVVLALPRGGVPVAVPIAAALGCPLDVVVARKIGVPWQPEFGVGALVEEGEPVFNLEGLRGVGLTATDLDEDVARERAEAGRRARRYRGGRPAPRVAGSRVVLVDDGLATGITAIAAARWLKSRGAEHVTLAVPVAAATAVELVRPEVDAVVCAATPPHFRAVGAHYVNFTQVCDAEVVEALAAWH
jgi:putative phosphoribosyl transferase